MDSIFGLQLNNDEIKALIAKENLTKKNKEEHFFLASVIGAKKLFSVEKSENIPNSEDIVFETINEMKFSWEYKVYISILFLYTKMTSVAEAKEVFRLMIRRVLDTEDDFEIKWILDEIKYLCEYEQVLFLLFRYGGVNNISTLPKRDRKKIYEESRTFERNRKKVIEFLKNHNLSTDEVATLIHKNKEGTHLNINYESTLKHVKGILYDSLIQNCETGKVRARAIMKILEYI